MIFRNVVFVLVAATPLFCLKFAGEIQPLVSNGGAYDLLAMLENYADPARTDREIMSDEFLVLSDEMLGAAIAEPMLNVVSDNDFFAAWFEHPQQTEPTLQESYQALISVTGIDPMQVWNEQVMGQDGWKMLRTLAGMPERTPVMAERPVVPSPFVFASHKPKMQVITQVEENRDFPADITAGRYRVVDNLGLVTEVVLTNEDIREIGSEKTTLQTTMSCIRESADLLHPVEASVSARQYHYLLMYNQWISLMNQKHVEPTVRVMLKYALPMDKAENSIRRVAGMAEKMWMKMDQAISAPTQLSNGPQKEIRR
ncbi:MAG: hypothetical protein R3C11_21560 [Planctomycetaceae bacterium]